MRSLIALTFCATVATAQGPAIKLSLAKPDWVSSEPFSQLTSIRVLSNGTVLAADSKDIEVHLLDANGKHVRQIGRKGSGPGEYSKPVVIALPADTTFLYDTEARRYILVDPLGKIVKTESIAQELGFGATTITAADAKGRLLFAERVAVAERKMSSNTPIGRWARGTDHFDTVTMFHTEDPPVVAYSDKDAPLKKMTGQTRQVFAAVDDWIGAPSGRIAIIHAVPYRVDWVEPNGKITQGTAVPVTRVPVTDLDRKRFEPDGPPFRRGYAEFKSPFVNESSVTDAQDNVWVPRSEAADFKNRRWDVFGADGKLRGTVLIPNGRTLMAITPRHAYIRYTDTDGLQWIERYTR